MENVVACATGGFGRLDIEDFPRHLNWRGLTTHKSHRAKLLAFSSSKVLVPIWFHFPVFVMLETGLDLVIPLLLKPHDDIAAF